MFAWLQLWEGPYPDMVEYEKLRCRVAALKRLAESMRGEIDRMPLVHEAPCAHNMHHYF